MSETVCSGQCAVDRVGEETLVQTAELCPAHCITPRNRDHGPTASRYWWAMMREIWWRWVRSWAAQVASNCDRVTGPKVG